MKRDDEFEHADMPENIRLIYSRDAVSSSDLDILVRYWTRKDGKFAEAVQQISAALGPSSGKVSQYLTTLPATAILTQADLTCVHCGTGPILTSRSDYQRFQKRSRHVDTDGFCQTCAYWHKPMKPNSQWVLGHLTRTTVRELLKRYYSQEDCSALVKEYAINVDPVEFAAKLNGEITRGRCRHCDHGYNFDAMSQVEYFEGYAERLMSCSNCGHDALVQIVRNGTWEEEDFGLTYSISEFSDIEGMSPCTCKQCERERNSDPARKRQRILRAYSSPKQLADINNLSLQQIVCLLGMLWSRTSEDRPHIVLAPNVERMHLTPQDRHKWDWMRTLTKSSVIYVDAEKSQLNAFEDDDINTYFMGKVTYLTNVTLDGESRAEPSKLLSAIIAKFRNGYWQERWTEELLPLWKDIATAECMAYTEERAGFYNLGLPNEEKLRAIFQKLLDGFSTSEIWYMISSAYMNAAAFLQSDRCKSHAHATNTVPSKIVSLSGQPRSQTKKWSRIKDIPRCAVTEVLFDIMLDAEEDAGFNLSPGNTWHRLLDRHLSRNPSNAGQNSQSRHLLASDEALRELAEEYGDPRIEALVAYAIAAREFFSGSNHGPHPVEHSLNIGDIPK
ncbi:hypothetical protein [Pseudogulbenkiania subflava]|uniref:Uncharacterized protein n=1 Tax=Pseudogulbenkiania subflava DSM 22618 TaxID=1123014 RepID=A0A1Y6C3I2_9NEIS|nr:hypothetical protein [Pseudogulbenkiania subflava]SMF39919.1 hypothetical protein SAMN02745746_03004 [Pseudogulbenkiania subflava DSM 22618]